MNCQDQKRIMHSTGIEKNGNSTEKIIGGKEAKDGISGRFCEKMGREPADTSGGCRAGMGSTTGCSAHYS